MEALFLPKERAAINHETKIFPAFCAPKLNHVVKFQVLNVVIHFKLHASVYAIQKSFKVSEYAIAITISLLFIYKKQVC